MVFLFIILYILLLSESNKSVKHQKSVLIFACVAFTLAVGFRAIYHWPDTPVYIEAYKWAPTLSELSPIDTPYGYAEYGYYLICVILKTVGLSERMYLVAMAGISMFLLYKVLGKYGTLPLIGVADYTARFMMNRDCVQMRSSLCILLIIWGLKFVRDRKMWYYFAVILLAYQFHHMALIGLPFYFFCNFKFTNKQIYILLIFAFAFAAFGSGAISGWAEANSEDLNYDTYVDEEYRRQDADLGLMNPMIYFQVVILLMFNTLEYKLKSHPYYYIFRNGYLYSTLILIVFCQFTALSGRTSTMFATCEMFMLPMMVQTYPQEKRAKFFVILGLVFVYFFSSKMIENLNGASWF